ncbi:MAG: cache domain-containing protein [Ignavibacteria bacterium]|nr:cache domain-containing protein [Ignavibacteria bacterium]
MKNIEKLERKFVRSIQSYLVVYFTIAVLLPTIVLSVLGTYIIYTQVINRAEVKTLSDLNSAKEIYKNTISHLETVARLTSARSFIINSIVEKNVDTLQYDLQRTLYNEKLDIFTLVDTKGVVICRARNAFNRGDTLMNECVKQVISTKQIFSGTEVVSAEELGKESYELKERAQIQIVKTPKSRPIEENIETNGLMIKSAVPIFDKKGNFIAVLIAGKLLNRNYDIVTRIKDVVHEGEVYKGKEIGTSTIFLKDVRISTNVKNKDGTYAIGTLVSEEVYNKVVLQGERWIGEAFVVNDWYIGAYDPIKDFEGNVIGMLYVGLLKEPFDHLMWSTILIFIGIGLGATLIIYVVAIFLAKRITTPLRKLEEVAKKITEGDIKQEFTIKNAPREVENLANSLDHMAKELEKEKQELEAWADKLELKVQERTAELKKIHGQLFRSEKLASIGKLAAGVAHEINNPLTGVLTNASLLLEDLPEGDPKREDVKVIVNETIRCREIVKRLLDFARQTKPQKKLINVNSLIENIILLVRNQTSFRNIVIEKELAENLPEIMADGDQIQQVIINFILNAADAMPKGGSLKICSKLMENGEFIELKFIDTGVGISEENRNRIFDPFFTTKENGTGLGLSISYGIIEQHGGTIYVDSEVGKGTTFTVQLPIKSPFEE